MKRLTTLFLTLSLVICAVSANGETTNTTETLNHLTMNQWVQVAENGSLTGRVFLPQAGGQSEVLADVSVAILARDGEVLRAKTNSGGEFQIADVRPGVYALTARGKNAFACCAMHVVDSGQAAGLEFPQQADIAMAGLDYTAVNTAVIRYLPPSVKEQKVNFSNVDLSGLKNRVCGESLFRVAQSADGMKGKLHVAGANSTDLSSAGTTNVFLYSEGREIARTLSSPSGEFDFEEIDPGFYSVLAIGPSGIGLIGFELVDQSELDQDQTAMVAADGTQLVGSSKHKLHTIGVMYLWMDMGGYACRQPFVVVRRLAADVIIGCTFLDEHAESLQIRRKVLILADGTPHGRTCLEQRRRNS